NYLYSLDAGKTWVTRSPASASTTIDLASLTTGKTYSLVTRAVSAHGFGLVSALVSFVPALPPAAPTALVATPGYASATVKFAAPGDNGGAPITGYEVSVNGGAWKAASPSGTSSPKTVMGLVNGTQTSIRLRAVNAAGPGAASAAVTVNPTGAPAAPTNVKAVPTDKGAWIGFTPPASNGGGAIVRYEYSLDYGAHWTTPVGGTTTSPMLITGLTNGTAYGIRIRAANAVSIGTASAAVTVAPSADPQPTVFVPVSPARVIDTRVVNGGAGPIKAKSTRMFSVRTTQKDGLPVVPAGATAVAINLTVPNPTKSGYLGLPTDAVTPPSAAAITFRAGETIANGITTTLTPARSIYLYAAVDAEAAVDVLGYYIPAALAGSAGDHGKFTAITPVRAYSSLVDPQGALAPTAPNQPPRTIKLATSQAGAPILPAGATSVAYNITVVKPDQAGHLRVMPGNQQSSAASAINWATKGDTIANGLVVNVDGAGAINVANWSAGKVNFLVDVVGYYSASGTQFYPLTSARVLDTRLSQGGAGPILAGNDGVRIAYVSTTQNSWQPVVPAGAKAISYNLTVTGPSTGGHLRVWPSNAPLVDASVLNWPAAGYTRSNGTMVAISDQRQVRVYLGSGKADAIIDVLGYYR
ncbi:MAG: hypothetical protein QG597_241, partial [Actinomycetota bacterium]|nr:hypothetical protein [Actinomycetota bacterium]